MAGLILELAFIMCALMRAPLLDWIFRGSRDMLRFASVSKHVFDLRDQIYQTVMMVRSMFLAPKSGALDVSVILGAIRIARLANKKSRARTSIRTS